MVNELPASRAFRGTLRGASSQACAAVFALIGLWACASPEKGPAEGPATEGDDTGAQEEQENFTFLGVAMEEGITWSVRSDGTVWRDWTQLGPTPPERVSISGIAVRDEAVWGIRGAGGLTQWDGSSWREIKFDHYFDFQVGLAIAPDGVVWTLTGTEPCGDSCGWDRLTLAGWDGVSWTLIDRSLLDYDAKEITAFTQADDGTVFVVGEKVALAWDGRTWTKLAGPEVEYDSVAKAGDGFLGGGRFGEVVRGSREGAVVDHGPERQPLFLVGASGDREWIGTPDRLYTSTGGDWTELDCRPVGRWTQIAADDGRFVALTGAGVPYVGDGASCTEVF